jgi:hypothetical protein
MLPRPNRALGLRVIPQVSFGLRVSFSWGGRAGFRPRGGAGAGYDPMGLLGSRVGENQSKSPAFDRAFDCRMNSGVNQNSAGR